jgi:2-hydroxychromene-2-carboxylate isomerase
MGFMVRSYRLALQGSTSSRRRANGFAHGRETRSRLVASQNQMPRRIEFFFDYLSPYSYLASTQLPALAARRGVEVAHRPCLLHGVLTGSGNTPPPTVPARAKHMPKDLDRWVRRYGVPFAFNPAFPMSTVTALRAAFAAEDAGVFAPYHDAMFRAAWVERRNLADAAVLGDVIAKAGLDAPALLAAAAGDAAKAKLKANVDELVARGGFGLPSFFVGDELFFGNDRLEFVEAAVVAES